MGHRIRSMKRSARTCSHGSCQRMATVGSRCALHAKAPTTGVRSQASVERHRFYQTAKWAKLRAVKLIDYPICEYCHTEIATEVDHFIPHKGDIELALDYDNLRSACKPCHSRKTLREYGNFNKNRVR